jgi:hypothetical protein
VVSTQPSKHMSAAPLIKQVVSTQSESHSETNITINMKSDIQFKYKHVLQTTTKSDRRDFLPKYTQIYPNTPNTPKYTQIHHKIILFLLFWDALWIMNNLLAPLSLFFHEFQQNSQVFTDNIKRSWSRSGRLQSRIYPNIH